jgi:hypothetical protein
MGLVRGRSKNKIKKLFFLFSFIFLHYITENPVIAYAIRSGDSFIFLYSIPENKIKIYIIKYV